MSPTAPTIWVAYPVPRGNSLNATWGDDYGNRVDRFNGGASFVTDAGNAATGRPSIITQRGYYTRLTISALNWRDGALDTAWIYDSNTDPGAYGQGNQADIAPPRHHSAGRLESRRRHDYVYLTKVYGARFQQ
jgi:hypothetical protein